MLSQDLNAVRPNAGLHQVVTKVTEVRQNCSIIWCGETMRGAVIDPGGDLDQILMAAEAEDVVIEQILVTHGHRDHCGGAADLAAELKVPIVGPHRGDLYWLNRLDDYQGPPTFHKVRSFEPDRWLEDGDRIVVGEQTLDALHCPGHTPGSIVYSCAESRLAFVGDVLFRAKIGSTRLIHGDHLQLLRSILEKLWPLGNDVTFVPGHGPLSTIGEERRLSPFISDAAMAPYLDRLMRSADLPRFRSSPGA